MNLTNTMRVDAAIRPTTTVADAREKARSFPEAVREPALAPGAADSVIPVVSELATNALRHSGGTA